jgi:hypothetical protein
MTGDVPTLQELLAKYLAQSAEAPVLPVSEVEPHQAALPAWTEPRAVWGEALRTAQLLLPAQAAWQCEVSAAWAKLLGESGTQGAVTFCLGHVPQLLYDVTPLLTKGRQALKLPEPRPDAGPAPEGSLTKNASLPEKFLHTACLRMAGHFAAAEQQLMALAKEGGSEYALLLANERAALAWQRGDVKAAVQLWSTRAEQPVFAFNLGLAALCQGDVTTAATHLKKAAGALPESDPWHHLAHVYLTLAEA